MRFGSTPFENWFGGWTQRAAWKWQKQQWKAQRRMMREQMRAQRHAMRARRGPIAGLFSFVWSLFWIALVIWFITGGHDARNLIFGVLHNVGHIVRELVINLTGAAQ